MLSASNESAHYGREHCSRCRARRQRSLAARRHVSGGRASLLGAVVLVAAAGPGVSRRGNGLGRMAVGWRHARCAWLRGGAPVRLELRMDWPWNAGAGGPAQEAGGRRLLSPRPEPDVPRVFCGLGGAVARLRTRELGGNRCGIRGRVRHRLFRAAVRGANAAKVVRRGVRGLLQERAPMGAAPTRLDSVRFAAGPHSGANACSDGLGYHVGGAPLQRCHCSAGAGGRRLLRRRRQGGPRHRAAGWETPRCPWPPWQNATPFERPGPGAPPAWVGARRSAGEPELPQWRSPGSSPNSRQPEEGAV